jgi:hypothetical protein
MAFKQNPGRGNNSKTGYGLPTPFKQDIELTKKYTKGKKTLATQREKGNVDSGMVVDKASGFATAKPYEKSYATNEKTKQAYIVGGDKKTTATASSYGNDKAIKDLRKRFVSDSTSTMRARNRSAELYNATSGGTSPDKLSTRQKASLVSIGKAKKVK